MKHSLFQSSIHFSLLLISIICVAKISNGQVVPTLHATPTQTMLLPGFDKAEYRELMYLSARTGTSDTAYLGKIPAPEHFKRVYRSEVVGLDNLWDLWVNADNIAVISIRGTTEKPESWLANFYAAMVPASGTLQLGNNEHFDYHFADRPEAAVHVGWLLSTAILSKDILMKLDSCNAAGIHQFIIMGHSQGGAIAYLLSSHFHQLQKTGRISNAVTFKTYCSAAPKPGNIYYAYAFEEQHKNGWAFNVVNALDWVPETPLSIQTVSDFNSINPFSGIPKSLKKLGFMKRVVLKTVYNRLEKPVRKAQKNYQKYLGNTAAKFVKKSINDYETPQFYPSNNYVRTGNTIVLMPDDQYRDSFPENRANVFIHHGHRAYLQLLENY